MAGLSAEAMLMLTKLDQARMDAEESDNESLGWVDLSRHAKQFRAALIRFKLMKKDDSIPNVYHITPKGQEALTVGFRPKDEPRLEIIKPVATKSFAVQFAEICSPDGRKSDDCASCVYRQAIDVLAAKVPGVRELVDALQTIENGRR